MFQLAAARRRLGEKRWRVMRSVSFNSQPREGGWDQRVLFGDQRSVSTRSRAKAAGNHPDSVLEKK